MINQLDKLTVCIFSFNRPKELTRVINYWCQNGVKTVVMDASASKLAIDSRANLKYFHVPNLPLQQRLIKFSENIETEYMLLSPDDDFFFPNGITDTIKFLDGNLDFSSAQGLRLRFYDYPAFNWIPDYLEHSKLNFEKEDKQLRLLDMYQPRNYIYSILRTSNYQKIMNCLQGVYSTKRNSIMMNEFIFSYTLPLLGKHKTLPILYSARKAHEYMGGDINFSAWINDVSDSDAIRFKRNIVEFYVNELNCEQSKANDLFDLITSDFSIHKKSENKKESHLKKMTRKVLFESRYRIPYCITKPKYLRFFWILLMNKKLILSMRDVKYFSFFLKHNHFND